MLRNSDHIWISHVLGEVVIKKIQQWEKHVCI